MSNPMNTYEYGNSSEFQFEVMTTYTHSSRYATAQRATIHEDNYQHALDDINRTFRVYEDKASGKHFEIAIANTDSDDETIDAEQSTFSSSISNNIGNAVEFAMHAAANPERRRIYIASYGNGGSSYWDAKEQAYIKETGRFTQPDGSPLPTVAALGRVLLRNDLVVSRISTDSAGGAYATALMTGLPEGQVTHAYFKSRPNITHHRHPLMWGARLQVIENWQKYRMYQKSHDSWRLTLSQLSLARTALSNIYEDGDGKWSIGKAASDSGLLKLRTDARALSLAGEAYNHPAARDTSAALLRQPEAKLTFHFPFSDHLYGPDLRQNVCTLLTQIDAPTVASNQVQALLIPGSHLDHVPYPTLRASIEAYAFKRS